MACLGAGFQLMPNHLHKSQRHRFRGKSFEHPPAGTCAIYSTCRGRKLSYTIQRRHDDFCCAYTWTSMKFMLQPFFFFNEKNKQTAFAADNLKTKQLFDKTKTSFDYLKMLNPKRHLAVSPPRHAPEHRHTPHQRHGADRAERGERAELRDPGAGGIQGGTMSLGLASAWLFRSLWPHPS